MQEKRFKGYSLLSYLSDYWTHVEYSESFWMTEVMLLHTCYAVGVICECLVPFGAFFTGYLLLIYETLKR